MTVFEELTGITVAEFRGEYSEKRPGVFTSHLTAPLGMRALQRALECGLLRPADIRLFQDGTAAPASSFTDRMNSVDVVKLADLFRCGHTVVVDRVDRWNPDVADVAGALAESLSSSTNVNAYYTPAASQGFSRHADDHDVLVWQTEGEKAWSLSPPPVELPRFASQHPDGEAGAVCLEVTLVKGSVLYIPRGWLHSARAQGSSSLHLTIGLRAYTLLDELRNHLEQCAEDYLPLRRAADGNPVSVADALDHVRERWNRQDFEARRARFWVGEHRGPIPGHFADTLMTNAAPDAVSYRRRSSVRAAVWQERDLCRLQMSTCHILMPLNCLPAVRWLLDREQEFSAHDVCTTLDVAGRQVLLHRLVEGGLLVRLPLES
jgi:lysine-specific demethylase/histidyl-hydroxylase NO66